MAEKKTARVVSARKLGDARLLELEPSAPLGFVGGQYLIVDSGQLLPNGKAAKRAYSILSSDARQDRFEIAVKPIGGPASGFLHAVEPGAEIPFSGPWGKLLPDDARPRKTLVIATDTGITAALGLVRSEKFAPQIAQTRLVWLSPGADYFLPESFVREQSPVALTVERLPPVAHIERPAVATAILDRLVKEQPPESVFLAGDGTLIWPWRAQLAPLDARFETFFNNPEKKST
jgi:ferredoxin-NADP reductase